MEFRYIIEGEQYTKINNYGQPIAQVIVTYKNERLIQYTYLGSGLRDIMTKEECKKYLI